MGKNKMNNQIRKVLLNAAATIKGLELALEKERIRTKMFDDIMLLHSSGREIQRHGLMYPTSTSDIEECLKDMDEASEERRENGPNH